MILRSTNLQGGNRMFRFVIGLLAAVLLASSAQAQQATRLDEIIKRGTLRVGMTGDYRPFTYLDKTTQKFGGASRVSRWNPSTLTTPSAAVLA